MYKLKKEKNIIKNKAGITLIALVISIIVLLILAGVSIMTLAGDNGLLNRTTSAKEKTEISKFIEDAKMASSEIMIDEIQNDSFKGLTEAKIINKLQSSSFGYDIEIAEEGNVVGITTNASSVKIGMGEKTDIMTVTPITSSGYYVKIDGQYYPIHFDNSQIIINSLEAQESINSASSFSIQSIETENEEIAIVEDIGDKKDTFKIKGITGGETKIIIIYSNLINIEVPITVEAMVTITAVAENGYAGKPKGVVSVSPTSETGKYLAGSKVILTVSEKSGFRFKGWYEGEEENALSTSKSFEYTIPNNGNSEIRLISKFNDSLQYGDQVTNIGKITVNRTLLECGWEYFLEDDEYIYFIYGDFLESGAIPTYSTKVTRESEDKTSGCSVWSTQEDREDMLDYLEGEGEYVGAWDNITTSLKNELKKQIKTCNPSMSDQIANSYVEDLIVKGGPSPEQFVSCLKKRYDMQNLWVKYFNYTGVKYSAMDRIKYRYTTNTGYLFTESREMDVQNSLWRMGTTGFGTYTESWFHKHVGLGSFVRGDYDTAYYWVLRHGPRWK